MIRTELREALQGQAQRKAMTCTVGELRGLLLSMVSMIQTATSADDRDHARICAAVFLVALARQMPKS